MEKFKKIKNSKYYKRFIAIVCILLIMAPFFQAIPVHADEMPLFTDAFADEESLYSSLNLQDNPDENKVSSWLNEKIYNATHPVKSFLSDLVEEGFSLTTLAATYIFRWIMNVIKNTFNPSLNSLIYIEQGNSIYDYSKNYSLSMDVQTKSESEKLDSSIIMTQLMNFSFLIAVIVATLLFFFNMFLIVAGQSEQIKDTPLMLFVRYVLSMGLIYSSKYFVILFINMFSKIWEAVMGGLSDTPYRNFEVWSFSPILYLNKRMYVKSQTGIDAGDVFSYTNISVGGAAAGALVATIGGIIFLVCVFIYAKELIKLFIEVIERYFVLIVGLAFFACFAATLTSNNSKKIFYSYLRFLLCQFFLLSVNAVFMWIFISVGLNGGWGAGIINYIAGLAFLRVCQRIDSYMAQLGFNTVQTGSSLFGEVGGALRGATGIIQSLGRGAKALNRGRMSLGKSMAERGIATNDQKLFKMGKAIGASSSDIISGNVGSKSTSGAFTQQVQQNINNNGTNTGAGTVHSCPGNASWNDKLRDANVSTALGSELDRQGIKSKDISEITQVDEKGKQFTLQGENAGATIDNGQVYTEDNFDALKSDHQKLQSVAEAVNPNMDDLGLSGATINNITPDQFSKMASDQLKESGVNVVGISEVSIKSAPGCPELTQTGQFTAKIQGADNRLTSEVYEVNLKSPGKYLPQKGEKRLSFTDQKGKNQSIIMSRAKRKSSTKIRKNDKSPIRKS